MTASLNSVTPSSKKEGARTPVTDNPRSRMTAPLRRTLYSRREMHKTSATQAAAKIAERARLKTRRQQQRNNAKDLLARVVFWVQSHAQSSTGNTPIPI